MRTKFCATESAHHLVINKNYEEMIKHMLQRFDCGYTCQRNCGIHGKVHFRIEGLPQKLVDRFNKLK